MNCILHVICLKFIYLDLITTWITTESGLQADLDPLPEVIQNCVRADVRIAPDSSPSCDQYNAARNVTLAFLYPPSTRRLTTVPKPDTTRRFSHRDARFLQTAANDAWPVSCAFFLPADLNSVAEGQYDSLLMSNVVPMYPGFKSKVTPSDVIGCHMTYQSSVPHPFSLSVTNFIISTSSKTNCNKITANN